MKVMIGTVALALASSSAIAMEFADDFNLDVVNPAYSVSFEDLANEDTVLNVTDGILVLDIEDPDPADDTEADVKLRFDQADAISATIKLDDENPVAGRQQFFLNGSLFNIFSDGGPAQDDDSIVRRTGNVSIEVGLNFRANAAENAAYYCFRLREADNSTSAFAASGEKCQNFEAPVVAGGEYTFSIGIDRAGNALTASVNNETIIETYTTETFAAVDEQAEITFRAREGAPTGNFELSSLNVDGAAFDLSIAPLLSRYRTGDFDNYSDDPDRSKDVVAGRLRLSATNRDTETDNNADLRMQQRTGYLEADLTYSSESDVVNGEGFSAVRVSGVVYNDGSSTGEGDLTGQVWAGVMLIENPGTGLVAEYCLLRAENPEWSESSDLADMANDDRCPTFDLQVQPDTAYNAVLELDEEARQVRFTIGGETKTIDIVTDIVPEPFPLRIQNRIARGATGTVVAYVDNVRNGPGLLTDEERLAMTDANDGETVVDTVTDAVSSGGGGCSIVEGQKEYSMLALVLGAMLVRFVGFRRRRG